MQCVSPYDLDPTELKRTADQQNGTLARTGQCFLAVGIKSSLVFSQKLPHLVYVRLGFDEFCDLSAAIAVHMTT
jgi:hypothetical protein